MSCPGWARGGQLAENIAGGAPRRAQDDAARSSDRRFGLVGIAIVRALAAVLITVPDYGPHIAVTAGCVFLVWWSATAKRRG
ncbi:hypothetical protein E1161_25955 [Saccharopolyspora aridisoli]|uniref:Uncharacterized protein n=1 Tax=Saccharopolyspora aridisoli TaxID=2530385 RepID=A0A4R4U7T7_9PSEU|nr:hypothetical protein [Saccharopolyspora aridisoli]TDC87341.1 hypothetical protein E1161_25955 [Saccharopolyspora aridisoli]